MANLPLTELVVPDSEDVLVIGEQERDDIAALQNRVAAIEEDVAEIPNGTYPNLTAGNIISNDAYNEDTEPYLFRALPYKSKRLEEVLVGATVNWNQLVQNGNFASATGWNKTASTTLEVANNVAKVTQTAQYQGITTVLSSNPLASGHKYLIVADVKADSERGLDFVLGDNTYFTLTSAISVTTEWATYRKIVNVTSANIAKNNQITGIRDSHSSGFVPYYVKNFNCIDLTKKFGSTIADYVYSLEQATAGSGIAWLKSYGFFTKPYYEYDAGTLKSVNLTAHVTRGVNACTEEWELGYLDENGAFVQNATNITCGYFNVLPSTNYYVQYNVANSAKAYIAVYDADKKFIGYIPSTSGIVAPQVITTPQNAKYMRINMGSAYGTTYNHDICINISNSEVNGKYFPYEEHTYPLDPNWVGRGIPKLDNGKLAFDGDLYPSDGNGISMYQTITFDGSEDWKASSNANRYFVDFTYPNFPYKRASDTKAMSYSEFKFYGAESGSAYLPDQQFALWNPAVSSSPNLREAMFHDTTVADVAAWKAKLASRPITIIFETEQVPVTAQPFEQYQVCETGGTEEYITTNGVPVGHDTKYYTDLAQKIADLPFDMSMIAPVEDTYTATRNYAVGSYLIVDNTFYKVTSAIANGGAITPNTNVTATTVATELIALR